ncbi:hypothetical protein NC652_033621 [Populus alba x Populus x berolinensis]|nr:hypothetical protein NC652_033621 [Populus alba x Populus x berolinensis]
MDHPSNGVSIMVCLRPSFADEESYLKRSFHCEDSDGYYSDWKAEKGSRCNVALKALCKKKGLHVEGANLVGIDSLGMDVRIFSGVEARTHRFPFKVRATCEVSAQKQMHQLLFPRSRRKKFRSHEDDLGDSKS